MNIVSFPGTRVAKGGSDSLLVVREEEMEVRLSVSAIILVKPAKITHIIPRENIPPVRVLYWVYELYLRSSDEQNISASRIRCLKNLRAIKIEIY